LSRSKKAAVRAWEPAVAAVCCCAAESKTVTDTA
jgi:hypothetical protein